MYKGEEEDTVHDDFAVNTQWCLWPAMYGAGKVLGVSPRRKVMGEVLLPTRCVAGPRIAGEDMIINNAVEKDLEAHPISAKYGGSGFKVNVGVKKMPIRK